VRTGRSVALVISIVIIAFAAAYGYAVIQHGFSARDQPSAIESIFARTARAFAVPSRARRMKNPAQPSPQVYAEARAHFADHCAVCHANNGSGDTPLGRNLYPHPPDLRLPLTQNKPDGELYWIIQYGIRHSGMPAFGDAVDDDPDTWKLVTFIRHLPSLSDQEEREMEHLNPKSPDELLEEQQEQQFLNNSETPSQNTTSHHH
jgi:mono/diheme cytochrome c family protein